MEKWKAVSVNPIQDGAYAIVLSQAFFYNVINVGLCDCVTLIMFHLPRPMAALSDGHVRADEPLYRNSLHECKKDYSVLYASRDTISATLLVAADRSV